MTDPKNSSIIKSGSGALSRITGSANPIVSRMADDVLRKANENKITQELIQLGGYAFCPQDYKQIIRWAEAFRLDPLDLLKIFEKIGDFQVVNGVILSLRWDLGYLPLPPQEWERDLSIQRLEIKGKYSKETSKGNLHLTDSNLPNLRSLVIRGTGPVSVTVTRLEELESLRCWYSNLSSIDLSEFPNLSCLSLSNRTRLTNISFYYMPNLKHLALNKSVMSCIPLDCFPNLESLRLRRNHDVLNLDLSLVPKLISLSLDDNQLEWIDLQPVPGLRSLRITNNVLTSIDLSAVPLLGELNCSENRLTEINLKPVPNLTELWCSKNQLVELDLSAVTNLDELVCVDNKLTDLNLAAIPKVTRLGYDQHLMPTLDLAQAPLLELVNADWL